MSNISERGRAQTMKETRPELMEQKDFNDGFEDFNPYGGSFMERR